MSTWPKVRVSFSSSTTLKRIQHLNHGTSQTMVHHLPDLTDLYRVVERVTRTQNMYGRQQVRWNGRFSLPALVTAIDRRMVDSSCELGKQHGDYHGWHHCHFIRSMVCQRRARGDEVFFVTRFGAHLARTDPARSSRSSNTFDVGTKICYSLVFEGSLRN